MTNSKEQRMADFQHKTFILMFRVLLMFGIPAAIAYFAGDYLDTKYDMRPYGTLAMLGIAFITSWSMVIRMYLSLERERKDIEAMPDEEDTTSPSE